MREQISSSEIVGYMMKNDDRVFNYEGVVKDYTGAAFEVPNIVYGNGISSCLEENDSCLVYLSMR